MENNRNYKENAKFCNNILVLFKKDINYGDEDK